MSETTSGMPGIEPRFEHYLYGAAPAWTLASDQRFPYYVYMPPALLDEQDVSLPLLILVHGTARQAQTYRDAFVDFAEHHRCAVLAPLFPCGIAEPDMDNYKRILFCGIRFDLVLLAMIDEVAQRYRLRFTRLLMHGFSGGGQFVHRFFYLHPHRLDAVSIGAPGAVTLIDDTRDWWVGTRDIERIFDAGVDVAAMRRVRVHTVIGAADSGIEEVTVPHGSRHWMPDANHAGEDRPARLAAVRRCLQRAGVAVEHTEVPGVRHDGRAVLPSVRRFFSQVLEDTA